MNQMLGDTVEEALDKMMMMNQHQHSDGLLQEFYMMTQQTNEPIEKYAVCWQLERCACNPERLWVAVRKREGGY